MKRVIINDLKIIINEYLDMYINETDDNVLCTISVLEIINSLFLKVRDKYKHIIKTEIY